MAEELLTIKEVAVRVRRSPKTVWREIRRGNLVARKVCGLWLIRPVDVEAWLERGRNRSATEQVVDVVPAPPVTGSLAALRTIEREVAA